MKALGQPEPVESPSHRRPHGQWRYSRLIQSLDPAKLSSSDFMDISGLRQPCISFYDPHAGHHRSFRIFHTSSKRFTVFPGNTKGFLYYHQQLGQLRFRLTETMDPGRSFDDGKDLHLPNGRPWYIIPRRSVNAEGTVLRTFLQQDGLFLDTIDNNGPPGSIKQRSAARWWLTKFRDPFVLDLSGLGTYLRYNNLSNHLAKFGNPLSCHDPRKKKFFFKGKSPFFIPGSR